VKSIDLAARTYQADAAIVSRLAQYARELAEFNGAARGALRVLPGQIQQRVLVIAIEEAAATAQQARTLEQFLVTAASRWPGLIIKFAVVP
jgi:hypothetical protein